MGGGDLNLKKSWHPLTMKNLERVWKAEQRHDAEQKRIQELQSEIKEERARDEVQQMAIDAGVIKPREDRVDWLYKGPATLNREEYLLGKPIDKAIDPTLIEEQKEKDALASGPGALFVPNVNNTTADLEVKIREDPLFLIKKNEEEAKKRLLDNPLKLQQLQKIILKNKDKKKHKHKSEKKSKKKSHHHHDDSSHSESESDTKQRHTKHSKDKHRDTSLDTRQERRNREDHSPDRERHRQSSPEAHWSRRTNDTISSRQRQSSPEAHRSRRTNDTISSKHRQSSPEAHRHRSPEAHRHRNRYRDRSPVNKRHHSPIHSRGVERSSRTEGSRNITRYGATSVTRKMDPQELERKRQEMMSLAKERDIERELRVKQHKDELVKEETEITMKGKEDFLKPMRIQSLTSSVSLQDRIHRNINSVQRTRTALDDDFLKR